MMKKRAGRLDAAISIRDAALEKVEEDGRFECTDSCFLLIWRGCELYIVYTTPLQVDPPLGKDVARECCAACADPIFDLPYSLNIWDTKGRLLAIEWDYKNHVDLLRFKRGKWEEMVLHQI